MKENQESNTRKCIFFKLKRIEIFWGCSCGVYKKCFFESMKIAAMLIIVNSKRNNWSVEKFGINQAPTTTLARIRTYLGANCQRQSAWAKIKRMGTVNITKRWSISLIKINKIWCHVSCKNMGMNIFNQVLISIWILSVLRTFLQQKLSL